MFYDKLIDKLIDFPLLKDDGNPIIPLSKEQKEAVKNFINKVKSGEYKLINYPCICGETGGILISEKDRYGIPLRILLCEKCGTIRSEEVLDEESTIRFYSEDYRKIYEYNNSVSQRFIFQVKKGRKFLEILENNKIIKNIKKVFEIGCGAGGILLPFKEKGLKVSGCDFDKRYLDYGISQGLNLCLGDYKEILEDEQDFIILSHVLEHFLNSLNELYRISHKLKLGGYLLIQIPSLDSRVYNPILKFQNAHVIQFFNRKFLSFFLEEIGFKIIYNELSPDLTFLAQKIVSQKVVNNANYKNICHYQKSKESIYTLKILLKKSYFQLPKYRISAYFLSKLQNYPTIKKYLSKIYRKLKTPNNR